MKDLGPSNYIPPEPKKERDPLRWLTFLLLLPIVAGVVYITVLIVRAQREYEVTTFTADSFTPVAERDIAEYAVYARENPTPVTVGEWMLSRQPVEYREGDVAQVWISYCKAEELVADFSVTLQSDEPLMTISPFIPRRSEMKVGCHQALLQLETIRQGTVPGEYDFTVTYLYNPPGRAEQKTSFTTRKFLIVEPDPQ